MYLQPTLLRFKFDNFVHSLARSKVWSNYQTDRTGHDWSLKLKPSGDDKTSERTTDQETNPDHWVSLYLCPKEEVNDGVEWIFSMIVRDAFGKIFLETPMHSFVGRGYGYTKFMRQSTILNDSENVLQDGALCVDALLQVKRSGFQIYKPPNPTANNMIALLESGKAADIVFRVSNEHVSAHSQILQANAPLLADFCNRKGSKNDILLVGTDAESFKLVLRYVYAGAEPDTSTMLRLGKPLIATSNKYEIVGLKVAVENSLVEGGVLNLSNVAEYYAFAEANTCPLLKEYAMSYIFARPEDVLRSEHSKHLNKSPKLLRELLIEKEKTQFGEKSASELRNELGERGLDVDGSKKMLLSRLEDWNKKQRTE